MKSYEMKSESKQNKLNSFLPLISSLENVGQTIHNTHNEPNQTETSNGNGNIIYRNIIHRIIFLYSFHFYILAVCDSFFLQKRDWSIASTYSTFLISHHTNPAYNLVYSKWIQTSLSSFHGAEKDRAEKYDFNTEKHDSYTENIILILKITHKQLKYCLEERIM